MFKKIVVGLGKSKSGQLSAQRAYTLASHLGATLHVVTAFKPGQRDSASNRDEAERLLNSFVAGKAGTIVADALPGDPVRAILQVATEVGADLIVVGNKGMRGAGRLLGSVPNTITHKAPCSVLIVKTT
jgi:nucleotide-binding universal stress UspA family protein